MNTEALLTERGKTHGDYSRHADVTQTFKTLQRRLQVRSLTVEEQEALDMIFHKLGRIITGNPHIRDHYDDIAGYATLASKSIKVDGNATGEREVQETTPTKEKVAIKAAQEACQTSVWQPCLLRFYRPIKTNYSIYVNPLEG